MSKLRFAAIILAVGFASSGFSSSAFAQRLSSEQREACKPDFDKLCADIKPGGGPHHGLSEQAIRPAQRRLQEGGGFAEESSRRYAPISRKASRRHHSRLSRRGAFVAISISIRSISLRFGRAAPVDARVASAEAG